MRHQAACHATRRCIESERAAEATHSISVGMVEIYNEAVWDLLAPGGKRELELAKCSNGFDLPNLTQVGGHTLSSLLAQNPLHAI